jgi:PAS domain S-box-containing protein
MTKNADPQDDQDTLGDVPVTEGNGDGRAIGVGRCQSACQLILSVLLLIVAMFGFLMWSGYQAARREAQINVANLAETLVANLKDELDRAESDLRVFAPQITPEDLAGRASAERRKDIEERMASHLAGFPAVKDFRVFDGEGRSVFGARSPTSYSVIDVSGRDWFTRLKEDPSRDLVLSEVVVDKEAGYQTIAMVIPLRDGNGRLAGAIDAVFNLGYFQDRINELAIGTNGLVLIRRTDDYRLVLRRPIVEDRLNTAPLAGGLRDILLSGQNFSQGDFKATIDNINRTYALQRLDHFPLAVVVALDKNEYLEPWREQMAISAAVTLILTLALLMLFRRYHVEQDRLARHAMRYRALMNTATDGMHIIDENGELVEASASFYRMLGYNPNNPPHLHVADWDARYTHEELLSKLHHLMDSGRSVFETRHRRVGNSVIDVEITCTPIVLGNRCLLYNSSRDISARKRTEQDLQAAAVRLNQVLDTVAEGILGLDAEGRIMFANPSSATLLGYKSPKELHGKTSHDATGHRLANHEACDYKRCHIRRTLDTGETSRITDEFFAKADGEVFPVEYVVSPLVAAGNTLGAIIAFHDISARRALETELRRSNAELEQFAYVASHDLRQPLRMISSYLGLIEKRLENLLDDETRRFFDFVTSGARKMDVMIVSLLELSRIGRSAESFDAVSLETVLFDALGNLRIAIDEAAATVDKVSKLPTVQGDANELLRLFQNLIGNAVKYRSPDRKLVVEIGARAENGEWVVWVKDNGIGIPPEFHERIFLIFQRLVPSNQIEGTGIGLAICQKIMQHHGGRIWVESNDENGTTFFLSFPVS